MKLFIQMKYKSNSILHCGQTCHARSSSKQKKNKKMIKKESANKTSGKEMFALFTLIVLIGCILLI